jgi:hypothetical protein
MRALIGVELLRKLPAGPCDIRDVKLPGFLLRVRASGVHTYYVNYGRGKWQKIGTSAALTAPEAREHARKVLGDVMKGGDPVADKRAEESRMTFRDVSDGPLRTLGAREPEGRQGTNGTIATAGIRRGPAR